ncbi:MAG: ribosome-binding factor A, partial [Actinobacteria bacterium RBG_19FT_COMBO_54_7]
MKRVNEACREALGEILQGEMKDPRVGFVTVTKVEVSPDLHQAKVWVSILGNEEEVEETLAALEKAKGFLRRELGQWVRLRYTPELKIFLDRGAEISEKVQDILHILEEARMNTPQEVAQALAKAGRIAASSHVNPDGDSVGSLVALTMALEGIGKSVHSCLPDPESYPPQYDFLPGRDRLLQEARFPDDMEVFVALDCSNFDRLEAVRPYAETVPTLINVDHHEDNQKYGTMNLVDARASSTSELVFKIIKAGGWQITPDIATCLYTGLLTDTGRFQHQNTSPETFSIASELADAGADIFRVAREVYESESLAYTRLLGLALERATLLDESGLIYSFITREDLEETGAVLAETEDMIDHLRAVRGAKIVALLKELKDGRVRVSLRTREDHQVGPIARLMGGGGHALAAGYTSDKDIEGSLEDLLNAL